MLLRVRNEMLLASGQHIIFASKLKSWIEPRIEFAQIFVNFYDFNVHYIYLRE